MNGSKPPETLLAVAMADTLAPRLIARAAPIRFATAQSPTEREAIFRLRYQVVVERGWAQPADFPGGLECDSYDDGAVHIVGWDGNVLVAASRLVFPTPGLALPTEEVFGLTIEPRGQVVDWSRFIVSRQYSNSQHRVLAALLARSWLEMRARGFWRVCGTLSPSTLQLYRRLGFQITLLGPPRLYWKEERYPARVDPVGAEATPSEGGDNGNGMISSAEGNT